jgi:hypothetical protein
MQQLTQRFYIPVQKLKPVQLRNTSEKCVLWRMRSFQIFQLMYE